MHDNQHSREERADALIADYLDAVRAGENPDQEEWLRRHTDFADDLKTFFADLKAFEQASGTFGIPTSANLETLPYAPRERSETAFIALGSFGDYEMIEELGRGGMGVVFKA